MLVVLFAGNAWADSVLVVHEASNYLTYSNALVSKIGAKGHTVTQATSFPSDVSSYDQLWDLRIGTALSDTEQASIVAFLNTGKSAFVLGENTSFATRNASIVSLVSLAGGGTVTIGSDVSDTQNINSPWNTSASSVTYGAAAGFATPPGTGTYITDTGGSSGNIGSAVAWTKGTLSNAASGTLVSVLDINFLSSTNNGNPELCDAIISYIADNSGSSSSTSVPFASFWQLAFFAMLLLGGGVWCVRRKGSQR